LLESLVWYVCTGLSAVVWESDLFMVVPRQQTCGR
jgi:hypothetical protein